jgi:hypothetical protein
MSKYIFLTTTYDGDGIYCLEQDAENTCKACECFKECHGADLKNGCGCLLAFSTICFQLKPIFYGKGLIAKGEMTK